MRIRGGARVNLHLPVTFGRAEGSVEAGGFRVTEAAYAANMRCQRVGVTIDRLHCRPASRHTFDEP